MRMGKSYFIAKLACLLKGKLAGSQGFSKFCIWTSKHFVVIIHHSLYKLGLIVAGENKKSSVICVGVTQPYHLEMRQSRR